MRSDDRFQQAENDLFRLKGQLTAGHLTRAQFDELAKDFPGETFRVLKEMKMYGEFRTRRLVLAKWDEMSSADAARSG